MVWWRLNALDRVLLIDTVHDSIAKFGTVVSELEFRRNPAIYYQIFKCFGYGRAICVP